MMYAGISNMKNINTVKLYTSIKNGQREIAKLSPLDKSQLERVWDIEHAYYSSALEGSNIDKKEFEKLAEDIS